MADSFWVELEKLFFSDNPVLQEKLTQLFNFVLDIGPGKEPELSADILERVRELRREFGEESI